MPRNEARTPGDERRRATQALARPATAARVGGGIGEGRRVQPVGHRQHGLRGIDPRRDGPRMRTPPPMVPREPDSRLRSCVPARCGWSSQSRPGFVNDPRADCRGRVARAARPPISASSGTASSGIDPTTRGSARHPIAIPTMPTAAHAANSPR